MVEDKWSKSLSFSSELSLCLLKYESDIALQYRPLEIEKQIHLFHFRNS